MTLKWQILGSRTWYGEDGWLRYHVERQTDKFAIARGGVSSAGWFQYTLSLDRAKEVAQQDATRRRDKLLALRNYPK